MVNELKRVILDFYKIFLINKFLLFQYSKVICLVPIKAIALKVAQNDHVLILILMRMKIV